MAGVGVAAGSVTETAGVAVAAGETDAAIDGRGLGLFVGGRIVTEADAAGVGLIEAAVAVASGAGLAALGAGVALGVNLGRVLGMAGVVAFSAAAAVALGAVAEVALGVAAGVAPVAGVDEGLGFVVADAAGVGLEAAVETEGEAAAVAAGVADAVAVELSSGFTNVFGGAFGGGVASARIFVRALSAAERSAIAVHPVSMLRSTTRSFKRRGRGISRISVMMGAEISSSSPRTVAMVTSAFLSRRSR